MRIYERKNFPRTSHDFMKMLEKGTVSFDNSVQRKFVWKNTPRDNRMSMLIDTMMRGFCVPPMYCNCIYTTPKDKVYDFIDGKQRVTTVIKFLNDEFALVNIPEFETDEGILDLNGRKYSQLPEEFQDSIRTYSFTVNYYENMEQDDVDELFRRLNNGKSLSAIEMTRVTAKSKGQIRRLASHRLFKLALNSNSMASFANEDIAIKSWILLFGDVKSFETKFVRPTMREADISEENSDQILKAFDKMADLYDYLLEMDSKESNRVIKKIMKKTHLLSLIPIMYKAANENIATEKVASWILNYFGTTKGATLSDIYNNNASTGSAKPEAVNARHNELTTAFESVV